MQEKNRFPSVTPGAPKAINFCLFKIIVPENLCSNSNFQHTIPLQHRRGVVHRDLKAENIMFASAQTVKVGDFGFSKAINLEDQLTTFCGSPPYAAPELFVADSYLGPAVDWWAFGVLVFYMVAGTLPFQGNTISKIKELILRGDYTIPNHVSTACQVLIRGLMTIAADQRFSIDDVIHSGWYSTYTWKHAALGHSQSPTHNGIAANQINDETVRHWLMTWWEVDRYELDQALSTGSDHCLTGIYRILTVQGSKFLNGKQPVTLKKRVLRRKTKKDKRKNHSFFDEDENQTSRVGIPLSRTVDECTSTNLRGSTTYQQRPRSRKTQIHNSRACSII